jgi:hypothetical protein
MTNSKKEYICPACGGDILYDPSSKSNICKFCDTYYVINRFSLFNDFTKDAKSSKCSNCGGNLVFENQKTAVCKSCHSKFNIILDKEVMEDDVEEVDFISPFLLDPKTAYQKMIRNLASNADIPLDLFQKLKVDFSVGIYVPVAVVNLDYNAHFSAKIGIDHWEKYTEYVTENNRSIAKQKQRKVTEWQHISDEISGETQIDQNLSIYEDDFSKSLLSFKPSIDLLCTIANDHKYDDYNDRFVSGYKILKFDYDKNEVIKGMIPDLEKVIYNSIYSFISADYKNDIKYRYSYDSEDSVVYIPVYLYRINYTESNYFLAQTGEVGSLFGALPKDISVKNGINKAMLPFWIYLVISIFMLSIPILGVILVICNIPVYMYFNSKKKTRMTENQEHRIDQAEMFLSGTITVPSMDSIVDESHKTKWINKVNKSSFSFMVLLDNMKLLFVALGITALWAFILDTVVLESLYKLNLDYRFFVYLGTMTMYFGYSIFIALLILLFNVLLTKKLDRKILLALSIVFGIFVYTLFVIVNGIFKVPLYNLVHPEAPIAAIEISFSAFLNYLNLYFNPVFLFNSFLTYIGYFSVTNAYLDLRIFWFVRDVLTSIIFPYLTVIGVSLFMFFRNKEVKKISESSIEESDKVDVAIDKSDVKNEDDLSLGLIKFETAEVDINANDQNVLIDNEPNVKNEMQFENAGSIKEDFTINEVKSNEENKLKKNKKLFNTRFKVLLSIILIIICAFGGYQYYETTIKPANVYKEAVEKFNDGSFFEALELFEKIPNVNGSEDYIYRTKYQIADQLIQSGNFLEAIDYLIALSTVEKYSFDASYLLDNTYYQLANKEFLLGNVLGSLDYLSKVKRNETSSGLYLNIAEGYFIAKDFEKAIEVYNHVNTDYAKVRIAISYDEQYKIIIAQSEISNFYSDYNYNSIDILGKSIGQLYSSLIDYASYTGIQEIINADRYLMPAISSGDYSGWYSAKAGDNTMLLNISGANSLLIGDGTEQGSESIMPFERCYMKNQDLYLLTTMNFISLSNYFDGYNYNFSGRKSLKFAKVLSLDKNGLVIYIYSSDRSYLLKPIN